MVSRLFCHFNRWVLQVDVISNCVFFLEHGLVAALRVFRCELSFVGHIRIAFLWDIKKIDSWQHVLYLLLPTSRHLLSWIDKLKVLNDLESTILCGGHALQRAVILHQVFITALASRVVIFRADSSANRVILCRGWPLGDRGNFKLTCGSCWVSNRALKCCLSDRKLGLSGAFTATQVALLELINTFEAVLALIRGKIDSAVSSDGCTRGWKLRSAL